MRWQHTYVYKKEYLKKKETPLYKFTDKLGFLPECVCGGNGDDSHFCFIIIFDEDSPIINECYSTVAKGCGMEVAFCNGYSYVRVRQII